MADTILSPIHKLSTLKNPENIETKIEVFQAQKRGWQLEVADRMLHGGSCSETKAKIGKDPQGGFAALAIVLSYFEEIGKYYYGYSGVGKSEHYFKKGFRLVFPDLDPKRFKKDKAAVDFVRVLEFLVYKQVRCGMYHAFSTGVVKLSSELKTPFAFGKTEETLLVIDSHRLVKTLLSHLDRYLGELKNPKNKELRKRFERRYDGQAANIDADLKILLVELEGKGETGFWCLNRSVRKCRLALKWIMRAVLCGKN